MHNDLSCAQAHWVGSKPILTCRVMQLKLYKPTMATRYSLRMTDCAVNSYFVSVLLIKFSSIQFLLVYFIEQIHITLLLPRWQATPKDSKLPIFGNCTSYCEHLIVRHVVLVEAWTRFQGNSTLAAHLRWFNNSMHNYNWAKCSTLDMVRVSLLGSLQTTPNFNPW